MQVGERYVIFKVLIIEEFRVRSGNITTVSGAGNEEFIRFRGMDRLGKTTLQVLCPLPGSRSGNIPHA